MQIRESCFDGEVMLLCTRSRSFGHSKRAARNNQRGKRSSLAYTLKAGHQKENKMNKKEENSLAHKQMSSSDKISP